MSGKPPSHMSIASLLSDAAKRLQPTRITCPADKKLGRLEAEILLGHVLKKDKIWLLAHGDGNVTQRETKRFWSLVARRLKHEPIAYLIGERDFYGRTFLVNKHVLVPRPETELMVELGLRINELANCELAIWDVGTGSGAIGVTLACELPSAHVLATDVSNRALTVAKQNAKRHGVAKRITFLKSNLLQPNAYRWLKTNGQRHGALRPAPCALILANLPYLPSSDKKTLAPDVTKYEPSNALFSGKDGLTLINRFLGQLSRHIPEWGYDHVTILLEYDPPQTNTLKALIKKIFPTSRVTVHRDLAGRERVVEIVIGP